MFFSREGDIITLVFHLFFIKNTNKNMKKTLLSAMVLSSMVLSPLATIVLPVNVSAQTSGGCYPGQTYCGDPKILSVQTTQLPYSQGILTGADVSFQGYLRFGWSSRFGVFLVDPITTSTSTNKSAILAGYFGTDIPGFGHSITSSYSNRPIIDGLNSFSVPIDNYESGRPAGADGTYAVKVIEMSCPVGTIFSNTAPIDSPIGSNQFYRVCLSSNSSTTAPINPTVSIVVSTSTIKFGNFFLTVTNPIIGDRWVSGTKHKVSWLANFLKGTNNTGEAQYAGVKLYYGVYGGGVDPYDHGDNALLSNVPGGGVTLIAINMIPVIGPIVGGVVQVLSWAGVFDTAPQGVPVTLNLVPYDPNTNISGKPIKLASGLVEQSSIGVTIDKKIPLGIYKLQIVAQANKSTMITDASGPFSIVSATGTQATTTSYNQSVPITPVGSVASLITSQATSTPPQNVATSSSATSTSTNTVITPAPTITFTASPASVTKRGSTTLTWVVTNAVKCVASTMSNGPSSGNWVRNKSATGGTENITNIMFNSTYVLTCTGSGGSTSASTIVTISPTAFFDIYSMTADAWDGLKSLFGF